MKIAGGANRLGALVIGGSIRGLSIARSLGRHGVPVWVTATRGDRLATLSRYTRRTLPWITGSPEEQVGYLLRLARDHHLDGWALFPTVDRSAALCSDGRPIASLTARRTRQYPIDFGRGSSFVETVEVPEIEAPAHRLLAAIHYTGLVELEFKYDRRDRRYKLLDFNARIWTWSSLCCRAGVDYPYLLWRMMLGNRVPEIRGRAGVRWVRMIADVPAAFQELVRGRLRVADYVRSFRGPLEFALSAADDPWPGVLDVPIRAHAFTTKILAHATNLARTVNWNLREIGRAHV